MIQRHFPRLSIAAALCCLGLPASADFKTFPGGGTVAQWFNETDTPDIRNLGKRYVVTDYGVVADSTLLQTEAIQSVIDRAADNGGGVLVIPEGTFLSGSLFFRPGTHLHIEEGGKLKGSDAITH